MVNYILPNIHHTSRKLFIIESHLYAMKQIIQDLSSGETNLIDSPRPAPSSGSLIIDTKCSLISVGTERMLVDFGKASLLSKARQQPDKVAQVSSKILTDGLITTVEAVRSKLSQPIPLGY